MAKEYNIARTSGTCVACERELAPGEEFVATVRETPDDLQREDYCLACWDGRDEPPDAARLGVWKSRVPQPREKKKVFVDDDLLVNFFHRLADAEDETKLGFRFVLTLVLMRKKILVYEGSTREGERDVWRMRIKGDDVIHEVVDPHLDEDRIAEVSAHLGTILEGEL